MNLTNIRINKFSLPKVGWFVITVAILAAVVIGMGRRGLSVLHIEQDYEVNPHAYGRPGHASDEAEVRVQVRQVVEWWYNPSRPDNNDLYVGLAGAGPTALIFYNATRKMVNTVYYEPTISTARSQAHRKGYTQLVTGSPIP